MQSFTCVRLTKAIAASSIAALCVLSTYSIAAHAQVVQQPLSDQSAPAPGSSLAVQGGDASTSERDKPETAAGVIKKPDGTARSVTAPDAQSTSTAEQASPQPPGTVIPAAEPKSKIRAAFEANRVPGSTKQSDEQAEAKAKPPTSIEKTLVVMSWAGAYGDAQRRAIISPVARNLGIKIERRARAHGESASSSTDVTELDQSDLIAACRSGQVLKLDDMEGRADSDDFVVTGKNRCGVPTFAWSSIVIANGAAMEKIAKKRYRVPGKLSHLLDTKRYPGKRALIREPKRLLEMLLLADGVSRDDLYARLATRQGQDQAFAVLDRLSRDIIWVDGSKDALLALDNGQATLAMTYSGRAFRRLIASRLHAIWDGHIIDYASWAVPAKSKRPDDARRFIIAATTAESLAAQARLWPYGPMRRSALPLARRHDLLDTELGPFMPTSAMRFSQGVVLDASFWAEHGTALQQRFDDWQAGIPMGIRVPMPTKAPPVPAPPIPRRNG